LLRRDPAGSRLLDLFFGAEPVFHVMVVFSPALLIQFVGAAADFIFNVGNGIFVLLD